MQVSSSQYIYPPRGKTCLPKDAALTYLEYGWTTQLKYNDSRITIKICPDKIELWNRHGERLKGYTAPDWLIEQVRELADALGLDKNSWSLLDGGLLDQKHRAIKDTIAIWDIIVKNGDHLLGTKYAERYDFLDESINGEPYLYTSTHHTAINFGKKATSNIFLARQFPKGDWNEVWGMIETVNKPFPSNSPVLEGVMLKKPNGELTVGFKQDNNTDWMVKSRVTTGRHRF